MFNKELTVVDFHQTQKLLAEITARALIDESFKLELTKNPIEVLEAHGIYFSSDRRVEVIQNTPETYYFVLPTHPTNLSEDEVQSYTSMIGEGGNSGLDSGGPRCTKP